MKRIIILAITSIFVFVSCAEQPDDFISKIALSNENHNSMYFKVSKKAYSINGLDTLETQYEAWIVRDNKDTGKKGYIWVNDYYRPYNMIYDSGSFFLAIPPKKVTVQYANYNESFISDADWIDIFLNINALESLIADSTNVSSISNVKYKSKDCSKVEVKLSKTKRGIETELTFIIDNTSLAPVWCMVKSSSKDEVKIEELFFSDVMFDVVNLLELKEKQKQVLLDNPVEKSGSHSETVRLEKMLHIGDNAPLFIGNDYNTGNKISLDDYIGKNIIIVDFWYTHCPPCVKAMPHLSDLNKKFESKGVIILGLNSVDNQERSLPNLDLFLSKRDLSYDVILTKPSVDLKYKISGYPTMYVIGKDGKIAFVEVGFDKEKFQKLTEVIEYLTK